MTEPKDATTENGLYAALAKVQADLPSVAKNKTGEVKKDGKKVYDYDYADLTDVSEAIMPLLGKNGLAFTARPTLNGGGQFVLAYSLLHSGGEREDGEYPLPSNGTPQEIGKSITYGRRYCLCAVTGVAPGGDDTDAAGVPAHKMDRSRADDWDNATPARPAGNGNGQVSRPAAQAAETDLGEPDEAAQAIADEAHLCRTMTGISDLHRQAHNESKLSAIVASPSTGGKGKLAPYLNWRRQQIQAENKALDELTEAGNAAGLDAGGLDGFVQTVTGKSLEAATLADLKTCIAKMSETAGASS